MVAGVSDATVCGGEIQDGERSLVSPQPQHQSVLALQHDQAAEA